MIDIFINVLMFSYSIYWFVHIYLILIIFLHGRRCCPLCNKKLYYFSDNFGKWSSISYHEQRCLKCGINYIKSKTFTGFEHPKIGKILGDFKSGALKISKMKVFI